MSIDVAVVTDHSYAPWCATTVASCADTTPSVRFHVMHGADLTTDDRDRLISVAEVRGATMNLVPVDEASLTSLPTKGPEYGERISWARLGMADLLPGVDRVVYLDADTLAVDSLEPLWSTDLGNVPIGAVRNVTERAMEGHVSSLGIDVADYFNAGVLLVDLAQWRAEDAGRAMVDFVRGHAGLRWFDQDALNATFADRWVRLDPRWNAMNSLWSWPEAALKAFGPERLHEAKAAPGILHFEGPTLAKPWHYLCDHPFRQRYLETLAETPWAGTPLWDRTVATRLIARLPRERRIPAFVRLLKGRARVARLRHRMAR